MASGDGLKFLFIAAAAIMGLQGFGIINIPILSKILSKTPATTTQTTGVVVTSDPASDDMLAAVVKLQHFASEFPIEQATKGLSACAVLRDLISNGQKK